MIRLANITAVILNALSQDSFVSAGTCDILRLSYPPAADISQSATGRRGRTQSRVCASVGINYYATTALRTLYRWFAGMFHFFARTFTLLALLTDGFTSLKTRLSSALKSSSR